MGWGRGTRTKRSPGNGNWSLWEAEGGHGTGGGPALPERQGMDRMHQQHGKCQPAVGAAPSPHPALGRRRQRHFEHPQSVGRNPWSEMPGGGEQHGALCALCADSCHLHSGHGHAGSRRWTETKPSAQHPGVVWDGPKGNGEGSGGKQNSPSVWHFPSLPACSLPTSQSSRSILGTSTASHLCSVCHRWEEWHQERCGDMGLGLGQTQGFGQGD